jgi:hypothetical protein
MIGEHSSGLTEWSLAAVAQRCHAVD